MNGNPMSVVEKSTHIGVQKSNKNSALLTVEENIKKVRRTVYNLMDFMEELVLIQRQLLLYLELMYYLY
jgi:hypothetical protein